MSGVSKRTYLREVNPYLICPLCRGYLIDATTVVECLHSFCRSCILTHLNTEAHCPSCKHVLNKAKPNIKADKALQDIVYKLVPGLYHKEMRKRREFYKKHPEHADLATPEQRGEDVSGRLIFAPEDAVSLSLEYLPPGADPLTILLSTNDESNNSNNQNNNINNSSSNNNNNHGANTSNRRYLQCPALVTIAHLKKFLALKYSIDMTRYTIEICHRRAPLPEHWTLMDVAYIYAWKRNAPMRFFYRVALEEQTLEAPPYDRPSTPGLGASLPPVDVAIATQANASPENAANDAEPISEANHSDDTDKTICFDDGKGISIEKHHSLCNDTHKNKITKETNAKEEQRTNNVTVPIRLTSITSSMLRTTNTMSTNTTTNTVTSPTTCDTNRQVKTPIKILKNSEGRYEVLRSSPENWNAKECNNVSLEMRPSSNPEFSVVSIGNGQNSNGVKITLKQCTPNNNVSKKPKIISNVLLHCGKMDKESSTAFVLQQLQKEQEKQQTDKHEKQRRKVTFVERPAIEKAVASNVLKALQKKVGEQQEKNQFLQSFQLTAREPVLDMAIESTSKVNKAQVNNETNDTQGKRNILQRQGENIVIKEMSSNFDDTKNKNNIESASSNTIQNTTSPHKRLQMGGINSNVKVNANKQCSDVETCAIGYSKTVNSGAKAAANSNPAKVDVYTFSNDPPVVPAGAVKRKCPPGLPIFDVKRKKQHQAQSQTTKKATVNTSSPVVQNNVKQPRKIAPHPPIPTKRSMVGEAGPSRISGTPVSKPSSSPTLSNDTRNILDGCGLNIPASLSITLTAPKSPGNNGGFVEPVDLKDNRKNTLGKVSPSITLNDRSVDPRVLKALKAGQIRMPTPPKPRQTKQAERDTNQQHITSTNKRKREQESRDVLDLSGGKKVDMHPLRIPQPLAKIRPKTTIKDSMPNISDQGQVVTLVGGHRYYRAPPGSLTPAAHRVSDCPLPTPARTPVYAPGFSSSLNNGRTNSNLSSVFPSLQSLYALSQAPNLQQFQMDNRLRLPHGSEANHPGMSNVDNRSINSNVPGKSHLAAQCAPVKPARSSIAPLAVPIAKQHQSNDKPACTSRLITNDTSKVSTFRSNNNEPLDSTGSTQQLSVPSKYSTITEGNNRTLPRNSSNGSMNADDKIHTSDISRDSTLDVSNESRKEVDNSRPSPHREAASPRVSSTASPSPPPEDSDTNTVNGTAGKHNNNVNTTSNGIDNDLSTTNPMNTKSNNNTGPEVSSSKSPASPDSSSVMIESSLSKSCTTKEQSLPSPSQTSEVIKLSKDSLKDDKNIEENSLNQKDKNLPIKQTDTKLTSEMFQKRLLAAFPSNEWANNPVAAEHLGNFFKSLHASIKSENKMESMKSEMIEKDTMCNESKHIADETSSKAQTDVTESS